MGVSVLDDFLVVLDSKNDGVYVTVQDAAGEEGEVGPVGQGFGRGLAEAGGGEETGGEEHDFFDI